MVVLAANQIKKVYGGRERENATLALNGVDISINAGEFIAIMGPSGSGKSTLLHILSGLDQPSSGEVSIGDQKLTELSKDQLALFRRRQLGFVFQDFNLLDSLTVKENIVLPMVLEKRSEEVIEAKVHEIASLFGIESILHKYPYEISGGQQQRTAVSRALVNEPTIILADEPTGNLDTASSQAVMECLEKVVDTHSATVLLVTHDLFAASYCQKVILLKDGVINSTLTKKGDSKDFLNEIMKTFTLLGGQNSDI